MVRRLEGPLQHLPLTNAFLEAHADALKGCRRTKGSLHFTPEAPLPEALVERLVLDRLADLEGGGDKPT